MTLSSSPPSPPPPGCPFVVGLPLRADQPIFGRDNILRDIGREITGLRSVNLIGERRMGKTSVLNHLVGNQGKYIRQPNDQSWLLFAPIDLQAGVTTAARFYGVALREILGRLPNSATPDSEELDQWQGHLERRPEAEYSDLERVLRTLRDSTRARLRPVLIIDEFERLLRTEIQAGFPYPDFFDGLRALVGARLAAMIVASRSPLVDYFADPARPLSLTSSFPTYFQPFSLTLLSDADADALLLQPSDHPLALAEVDQARRWGGGHPCHLQAAGKAWYEARADGRPEQWAKRRFSELKRQNCLVLPLPLASNATKRGLWARLGQGIRRGLRFLFWVIPVTVGRLAQKLGAKIDDVAAWILGAALLVLLVLLLLGIANGSDVLDAVRKGLGL